MPVTPPGKLSSGVGYRFAIATAGATGTSVMVQATGASEVYEISIVMEADSVEILSPPHEMSSSETARSTAVDLKLDIFPLLLSARLGYE